jgi:hypothetical protein
MSIYMRTLLIGASFALVCGCASTREEAVAASPGANTTATNTSSSPTTEAYEQSEIVDAVADFFGITSQAAGQLVERTFRENGRPVGYIRGEEAAAAIGVGVRYGEGDLRLKNGATRKVFWQGPSVGWDAGGNASKVFTLVYGMSDAEKIYQRYPGVEGSAYFVGGIGVNYQRSGGTTLVPMRAGVGLRAGANVGYLSYTKDPAALIEIEAPAVRSAFPCHHRNRGVKAPRFLFAVAHRAHEILPRTTRQECLSAARRCRCPRPPRAPRQSCRAW